MIGDRTLFVASGIECWKIKKAGVTLVNELLSSQEEADTRILLHAKHASQHGHNSIMKDCLKH